MPVAPCVSVMAKIFIECAFSERLKSRAGSRATWVRWACGGGGGVSLSEVVMVHLDFDTGQAGLLTRKRERRTHVESVCAQFDD